MSADLERRYARLLGAYPSGYRQEHREEILATLLDSARPGQRHPSVREAAALVIGGLRTRARLAARQSPWSLWAEGLRLGVLLLVVSVTASAAMLRPGSWATSCPPWRSASAASAYGT